MPKFLRIAIRDYSESVRTKAFLISIVLAPIFMSGGLIGMVLLEDQVDTADKHIALIDHTGQIAPAVIEAAEKRNAEEVHDPETGKKVRPAFIIEVVEPSDDTEALRVALSQRIDEHELASFVEIGAGVVNPQGDEEAERIRYHSSGGDVFDELRRWIGNPINTRISSIRLAEAGLDETMVRKQLQWVSLERAGLVTKDEQTGEVTEEKTVHEGVTLGVSFGCMMLLFMMLMTGAVPLIHSTLEEKTQRISEVLLGSIPPFQLMLGKLVGNYGVALTVAAVYLGGGIIVGWKMDVLEYVPLEILPWFFVNMCAAIFMFGALCIAVGAACNDAKEAQSLTMPIMLPLIVPMMVMVPIIKEPLSTFSTVMSLIPPFTPMIMLLRQSTPAGIPAWQPWVGLVGMIGATLLCVWAGGRIFRVGLLMQGKGPKITDLVRWAIRG